ncbi:MAG: NAD-dependent epimerase/dehydratase family protein [Candidatus Micrarchaeota archaeon]
MANKIYVTGGSGRLGRSVIALIPGCVPLVRRPSGLPGERVTDFSAEQLRSIIGDAKAVVHLAGEIFTRDRKRMFESNVGLTWRIVDALPRDAKIVFASSISVFGKRPKVVPADEKTPPKPDSEYSRSKLEAEGVVAKHQKHCILRLATIYGPSFEDYFRILEKIEKGKMRVIGSGQNRVPFVHVEDAAKAVAAAVERGQGVYVVSGPAMRQKDIYDVAAKELGVAPPAKSIPIIGADIAGMLSELTRGRGATTREHIAVLSSDRYFDCSKAKAELDFMPRPLEDGIREMAAEYKRRKAVRPGPAGPP